MSSVLVRSVPRVRANGWANPAKLRSDRRGDVLSKPSRARPSLCPRLPRTTATSMTLNIHSTNVALPVPSLPRASPRKLRGGGGVQPRGVRSEYHRRGPGVPPRRVNHRQCVRYSATRSLRWPACATACATAPSNSTPRWILWACAAGRPRATANTRANDSPAAWGVFSSR